MDGCVASVNVKESKQSKAKQSILLIDKAV